MTRERCRPTRSETDTQQEHDMAKSKRMQQTSIPGTEPVEVPEVRDALHKYLDLKDEQRQSSLRAREAHGVLMAHMLEAKVERYPYVDSITGKKKHVLADRTPKAKLINAPAPKRGREDRERPEIDAEIKDPSADKVETRRVSRESALAEIKGNAPKDGFAATRALMEQENETEH
jgi:hypothetical protein